MTDKDLSPSAHADTPIDISVIVPCRNEARYIDAFLRNVLAQRLGSLAIEILVADGESEDGTHEIIEAWASRDGRIRLIDNPGRVVSTGLNSAIRCSRGSTIVRMDVHTEYAQDYLAQCVATLTKSGADNVGGPWRAAGNGYWQTAVALAFQSPFSSGGAGSHRLDYEGPVDSVYLGCWRRDAFDRFGMFDEELVRNQDDELNLRIIRGGGKVWQNPEIRSSYHPRASLQKLFAQYAQYGYWKVRVIQKHRIPASVRHLAPALFVAALGLSLLLSPLSAISLFVFLGLSGSYVLANMLASLTVCARPGKWRYLPVMPLVFAGFHFGYGVGFLRGLWDFIVRKRAHEKYSRLTRTP